MNSKSTITQTRRSNDEPAKPMAFESLPFAYRPAKETGEDKRSDWTVPPTSDYGAACEKGRDYAAHLAQYLKENPQWVDSNVLNGIVSDMDFLDESAAKGYWVGFFAEVERMIYSHAKRTDVFVDVARINTYYASLNAAINLEADEFWVIIVK